jgi:hypothetical protein
MRRGGPCWARDNHYDGAALLTSINDVALLCSGLHGHEANRAWLGRFRLGSPNRPLGLMLFTALPNIPKLVDWLAETQFDRALGGSSLSASCRPRLRFGRRSRSGSALGCAAEFAQGQGFAILSSNFVA